MTEHEADSWSTPAPPLPGETPAQALARRTAWIREIFGPEAAARYAARMSGKDD
jgi:hypothetical protein